MLLTKPDSFHIVHVKQLQKETIYNFIHQIIVDNKHVKLNNKKNS